MPVSSVQFGQSPWKYANGLQLSNDATTPDEIIDVSTGACMDSTGVYQIEVTTALTASNIVSGINGLDTGTVAASTLYAVHVIADPVTQQAEGLLLSLSTTAPLLPFGYSVFKLIGYVRTNGSSDFLKGYWTAGNSSRRTFVYDAPIATAVTAGAATSYTAVSLATFVPVLENTPVSVAYSFTPGAASRVLNFTPGNGTGNAATITGQVVSVVVSGNISVFARVTSSVPEIDYKVSNAGDAVAINVAGYDFFI